MNYKVLFVDDDAFFQTMVAYALDRSSARGLELRATRNLEEARRCLQEEHFDAILLDFDLPDGLGLELIPEIPPKTAILLLTGVDKRRLKGLPTEKLHAILHKSEISPHTLGTELINAIQRMVLRTTMSGLGPL